MTSKLIHSWQIFKASIQVTFRHPKLLWFPFLTTVFTGIIALFFLTAIFMPIIFVPNGYPLTDAQHWKALMGNYPLHPVHQHVPAASQNQSITSALPGGVFFLLPLYLVSMFLATFFNVAYYNEIIAALNGRGVSFRRGFGVARSRLLSILAWSLLAGLVGWLIHAVQERLPFVGKIVTGLIGIAWSVATVFAIPVIIQEESNRNPLKILQQSASTLKRTWGEGLVGYVGFSAANMALFIGWLVPLIVVCVLAVHFHIKSLWLGITLVVIWFGGLMLMSYVSNVAKHVYQCALYVYAAEGVVPEPYNEELLDNAWRVKKG
jgi:hypothetical protein